MTVVPTRAALLVAVLSLGCAPRPSSTPAVAAVEQGEASGPASRWAYTIALDEELSRMQLGLCVEGPWPERLVTSGDGMTFVRDARVRGGEPLRRDRDEFVVDAAGEHGCFDFEIDIDAAVGSTSRDAMRRGDSLMLAPALWLWHPSWIPSELEAHARLELPEGIAATVPWPRADDATHSLDRTSFGWNGWISFGRYRPIEFEAAEAEFEVAVLAGERRASDAGIEAWIRAGAEASAQLYGRFPRERVSVVVVPTRTWGDTPVLFGMARRGGGASVLLLINTDAEDDALPGEWVATHELLHLGMPLVADPWMSEGFVTYYTTVLRARQGLLVRDEPDRDRQIQRALEDLHNGFGRARSRTRTLASTSANMRTFGGYTQVYWGGAAIAFAIDRTLRAATQGRHSLDDLMRLLVPLASQRKRWSADELMTSMDEELDRWRASEGLDPEISIAGIATRLLSTRSVPDDIEGLDGLAVEIVDGRVRLLADPIGQVQVRDGLFEPFAPNHRSSFELP